MLTHVRSATVSRIKYAPDFTPRKICSNWCGFVHVDFILQIRMVILLYQGFFSIPYSLDLRGIFILPFFAAIVCTPGVTLTQAMTLMGRLL